jgi:hypothetical protein
MSDVVLSNFDDSQKISLEEQVDGGDFVYPRYRGESILNILPTVGDLFGIPGFHHPPLQASLLDPLRAEPQNVIVVLLDALAYHRLAGWIEEDESRGWNALRENGLLVPLTSICPSTTCAAITSFWTDSTAAEHGIMGYEMWLKEFGITANMIEHKPISYRSPGGSLTLAGFDPHTFLPVGSIAPCLQEGGVAAHVFQHYSIINSGLSQMFMEGAERHPIATAPDMWIKVRELLEADKNTRKYIWAYWGQLDGSSHLYGPDSEHARAEFLAFGSAFQRYFLDKIDPQARQNTLVILTADHGQITTNREADHFDLNNHPRFRDMMHILPTGENRLAYLFIKPGMVEDVKDYIQDAWPDQFALFDTEDFLKSGLFGPGQLHPAARDRVGDLIAAARGDAFWWWASKPNPLIGRHGGFSPQEMLVPFLAGWL